MRHVGKFLQVLGLNVLPLSMMWQLTDVLGRKLQVSEMVIMLVFGVCSFCLGRMLEAHAS